MGGRIWAESPAAGGSTFIVELPLTVAAEPAPSDGQEPARRFTQTDLPLVPSKPPDLRMNVLVAEDSYESQELMRFYFQNTPYQLEIVSNGEQAVATFQANRFDIVLIDLQMPGMDGFTATRLMRAWESTHRHAPIPVLALTANAYREAEEQSRAAGCSGFLTKPITRPQLLDALNAYCLPMPIRESKPGKTQISPHVASRIAQEIEHRRPQFLAHRRKDLDAMRQAAAQQDYETIRTMSHRIKGVAGSYGFPDIGALGQLLEQAARTGDLAAIHQGIDRLAALLRHLDQAA
jgi:CheY-like chemotaxis protein